MVQQRVVLSAVSSEFKSAREALAHALRAAGFHVEEQDTFVQRGTAPRLLRKLHDYIEDCLAVVCLIGSRTGAFPQPAEAAEFPKILPVATASYTQWEYFLARHFHPRLYLYVATDAFPRDQDLPADPAQARFIAHLVNDGIDRTPVGDAPTFLQQVLQALLRDRDAIPGTQVHQPIALLYPSLGSLFKGRARFLTRLRDSLTRDNDGTAAIVSNAVHGMGGIGKTRAAVEYAWAYRQHYSALLFVQVDTGENLEANLAALTGPLRLAEATATDQSVKLHASLAWLRTNPGWFLILDNVDTDAARQAAVAMLGRLSGGHVVLTSRLDAGAWDSAEPLDLDVLGLQDAAEYLQDATEARRLKRTDDAAQARTLATELGQLALALTLAAATIRERQCSFAEYRVLWAEAREKVRGWNQQTITGYHTAVGQTWQTSVAQVSAEARVLLERLAFLAPDPVPGFLLEGEPPGAPPLNAREALLELARYSLVTREPEADRFTVHRLVQDVTRRALNPAATRDRLTEVLGWVNAAFGGDPQDVRNWGRLDPLAPHAEAVAKRADAAGIAEPTGWLMNQLGMLFQAKALYARAELLMRRVVAIGEASLGNNHPTVATCLNNLAGLLQATNRLGEAEPLMRRALTIDGASYGNDHPNVAIRLNNLAALLQDTNRLGEAEPLMRRALGIVEASYGKDHPGVASYLNNLAALLQDTNRLGEAEPLMRRALDIDEASYGKDHPNVAGDLNNLAHLLQATNRLGEAEPLIRRALAIDEASYGKDHPRVAIDLNNVAQLLQATNRLGEAEPLMRRALGIDEASYGKDHPSVARCLNNLAALLHDTNRLREAEPLMRRALGIDEASYGKDHPRVAIDLNNLAQLLQATNRLGEAEPLMCRALGIDEASYGKDHPRVAIRLSNLAQLLQTTNRLGEAEPLMRRMVVIFLAFERAIGHAHPHRDAAIGNYAGLLAAMGKSEAEIAAAIAALQREVGPDQA